MQTGSLRDSRQHHRSEFLVIVERKDEVGPALAREGPMGTRLSRYVAPDCAAARLELVAMLEPLSQYAQRQSLHLRDGFRLVGAVAEHAREVRDLGDPAAILLTFELNREDHNGTLAPGWRPNKPLRRRAVRR